MGHYIAYWEPCTGGDLWRLLWPHIAPRLPLRDVTFRSTRPGAGPAAKSSTGPTRNVNVQFVKNDDPKLCPVAGRLQDCHREPFLCLLVVPSDDSKKVRTTIKDWVSQMNDSKRQFIVMVVSQSAPVASRSARISRVFDKLRSDMPKREKVCEIRLDDKGDEQWEDFLTKAKDAIATSFEYYVSLSTAEIKNLDAARIRPNWNYCSFFLLKESLAFIYEQAQLLETADVLYAELSALMPETCPHSDMWTNITGSSTASLLASEDKEYRDLIASNKISKFELSQYLFARQASISFNLYGSATVASKAQDFIKKTSQILLGQKESLPSLFVESWIFTACLFVADECLRHSPTNPAPSGSVSAALGITPALPILPPSSSITTTPTTSTYTTSSSLSTSTTCTSTSAPISTANTTTEDKLYQSQLSAKRDSPFHDYHFTLGNLYFNARTQLGRMAHVCGLYSTYGIEELFCEASDTQTEIQTSNAQSVCQRGDDMKHTEMHGECSACCLSLQSKDASTSKSEATASSQSSGEHVSKTEDTETVPSPTVTTVTNPSTSIDTPESASELNKETPGSSTISNELVVKPAPSSPTNEAPLQPLPKTDGNQTTPMDLRTKIPLTSSYEHRSLKKRKTKSAPPQSPEQLMAGVSYPQLTEVLQSQDAFDKLFLDLTVKALKEYETSERTRSVDRLNREIALFYFKRRQWADAEPRLKQVVTSYMSEGWHELAYHVLSMLAHCQHLLHHHHEFVDTCLWLLSPMMPVDEQKRLLYTTQLFHIASQCLDTPVDREMQPLLIGSIALNQKKLALGSTVVVQCTVFSNLPRPVKVDQIAASFRKEGEGDEPITVSLPYTPKYSLEDSPKEESSKPSVEINPGNNTYDLCTDPFVTGVFLCHSLWLTVGNLRLIDDHLPLPVDSQLVLMRSETTLTIDIKLPRWLPVGSSIALENVFVTIISHQDKVVDATLTLSSTTDFALPPVELPPAIVISPDGSRRQPTLTQRKDTISLFPINPHERAEIILPMPYQETSCVHQLSINLEYIKNTRETFQLSKEVQLAFTHPFSLLVNHVVQQDKNAVVSIKLQCTAGVPLQIVSTTLTTADTNIPVEKWGLTPAQLDPMVILPQQELCLAVTIPPDMWDVNRYQFSVNYTLVECTASSDMHKFSAPLKIEIPKILYHISCSFPTQATVGDYVPFTFKISKLPLPTSGDTSCQMVDRTAVRKSVAERRTAVSFESDLAQNVPLLLLGEALLELSKLENTEGNLYEALACFHECASRIPPPVVEEKPEDSSPQPDAAPVDEVGKEQPTAPQTSSSPPSSSPSDYARAVCGLANTYLALAHIGVTPPANLQLATTTLQRALAHTKEDCISSTLEKVTNSQQIPSSTATSTEPSSSASQSSEAIVGEPMTRHRYDIREDPSMWLVCGNKRYSFFLQPGEVAEFTVFIIPLQPGYLPVPTVALERVPPGSIRCEQLVSQIWTFPERNMLYSCQPGSDAL
ncbi:trafficking protein particle complex subunit 10 [Pelomyxa schiedti]|nr:trafficking protein particle complex subunit 10 [Pelomyxa schiedti]